VLDYLQAIRQLTLCELQEEQIVIMNTTQPDKRRSWGRTALDLPLLFFLSSAFIGAWVAYDRSLSWSLLATLVGSVVLYLAIAWPGFGETGLRRLAWAVLLVQCALALYFVTQFNHLGYPVKMGIISRLGELTGGPFPAFARFYPHPNALATFVEGGLPLAAGLGLSARERWGRLAAGLSFLLLGYGLLLTASRGAWVATAACAGLTLVVWGGRRLPRGRQVMGLLVLIVLAAVAGAGVMVVGPDRVPGLSSALGRGADRAELYTNSLHLIRDYPLLGIGLGDTFALIYSKYMLLIPHAYLTYAHNLPLAIWLNQGLLGLVSFGWLLVAFYGLVIGRARRGQGSPPFWGAVLGVTAMVLHGLTDAPQYADSRWVMPLFYALLGLSVAMAPPPLPAARPLRSNPRRVAFVALAVVALSVGGAFLLADTFYANLGAIQQARADLAPDLDDKARQQALEQATHYYQRALELRSEQPVAHWRLGLIALNADHFSQAITHLEVARAALPGHRGVHKALGYAYLWDGQIERAATLLSTLAEVPQELDTWSWWRGEQGQEQLADYARQLRSRLNGNQ
jgi:putative inorganic carbon (HCO3(-)) transporter